MRKYQQDIIILVHVLAHVHVHVLALIVSMIVSIIGQVYQLLAENTQDRVGGEAVTRGMGGVPSTSGCGQCVVGACLLILHLVSLI